MKNLIIFLIIITAPFAYSEFIHFGVYTSHFHNNSSFNNNNSLVAIQIDDYYLASFTNSYGFQTYFGGIEKELHPNASLIYGLSYGYNISCFKLLAGSQELCNERYMIPNIVPLATVRLHYSLGPVIFSTTIADYYNLSIGFEF